MSILSLDLNSSDFAELVDILKETVDVVRSGQSDDDPMIEVAMGIEMVIQPVERPEEIRWTAQVNENPMFNAWLLVPNPNIKNGDIVQRAGSQQLLFIDDAPPAIAKIQTLHLRQERT